MSGGLGGLGEFGLIRELTASLNRDADVPMGLGDDCAVIEAGTTKHLLTCDASLEGIHFDRRWGTPDDIGWKAAVSALSDIAAMGGRARYALVTLALPEDAELGYTRELYRGIAEAVEAAGAIIIGGDTTASRSGIVVDIMVVGEVLERALFRKGARAGDFIAATGMPGRRGAGLHALLHAKEAPSLIRDYLRPVPRLPEGQWFQAQPAVQAMMDLSDGILPDVRHIAEASGVGIDLWPAKLPPDDEVATYWASAGQDSGTERLRSGEEYELLVVLAPDDAAPLCAAFETAFRLPLTVIGRCETGPPVVRIDGEETGAMGFEHFRG